MMQADFSRQQWLGMAIACAITMATGIVRTRLAQDAVKQDVRPAVSERRENGRDSGPGAAVAHPDSGLVR